MFIVPFQLFCLKFFPKNGRKRLRGKEIESINIDNFSESLAAGEAKKRGAGGESESCGQVSFFFFLSPERVQLIVMIQRGKTQ